MKKIIAGIIAAACIATLGGATVFAAGLGGQNRQSCSAVTGTALNTASCIREYCQNEGNCFTDNNGDGICDNRDSSQSGFCRENSGYCHQGTEYQHNQHRHGHR